MATLICTNCGYEGKGTRQMRGSKGIEMFLWTVLLFPGPFYSLWRRSGVSQDCPNCHMPVLVKLKSDVGWLTKRKFDMELGLIAPKKVEEAVPVVEVKETPAAEPEPEPEPKAPILPKKPVDPDAW